jgi:hypothetical protein
VRERERENKEAEATREITTNIQQLKYESFIMSKEREREEGIARKIKFYVFILLANLFVHEQREQASSLLLHTFALSFLHTHSNVNREKC